MKYLKQFPAVFRTFPQKFQIFFQKILQMISGLAQAFLKLPSMISGFLQKLSGNRRLCMAILLLFPLAVLLWFPVRELSGNRSGTDADYYALYFLERDLHEAAGQGALQTVPSTVAVRKAGSPKRSREETLEEASALLEQLLSGSTDERFAGTIPPETHLLSVSLYGSRAVVDFSEPYSSLSGVALTLADYAVTLTLTQIPEISLVQITVRGQTLDYRDKQSFMARDVVLVPDGDVVGTVEATLYFPGADGTLTAEERSLLLYEGDTQAEAVVQALEGGPVSRELSPAVPEGFRIRSARVEGETCFVNLSAAFSDVPPEPETLSTALNALDLSLCSLESVREVRYLADGEFSGTYGGVSLTEPYAPLPDEPLPET